MLRQFRCVPAAAALLLAAACSSAATTEPGGATGDGGGGGGGGDGARSGQELWLPEPGAAWQWQLTGEPDLSADVPVYDVDGFATDAAAVAQLHDRGVRTICYLNTGAWEEWRPDAGDFPEELLGEPLDGWADERWLDIRQLDALKPLMAARLDMCRDKGFDAVEPDNMDGYDNDSGFPLTAEDQLAYNRLIAGMAHERGMSVGLKNDLGQVDDLAGDFDFAVNEECYAYDECEALTPFTAAGKAVFHVEYEVPAEEFCPVTTALGFSSMAKHLDLDAWRGPC